MTLTRHQERLRRTGIAASEIAAVAGLSPWQGPHEIWERKIGIDQGSDSDNQVMRWGRYMEPAIIAMWKAQTGRKVRYATRHQRTVVHPKKHLCIATPDGLVDPDALLEIKTYGWQVAHHWGPPGSDDIPEYYLAQITWGMAATGRKKAIVVAAHDRSVDEYQVRYDPEFFDALYDIAQQFWAQYVVSTTPPPIDHTDRCREFLQRYYPRPLDKELIKATPEAETLAFKLRDAEIMCEEAKRRRDELRNQLMEQIGSAYGLESEVGKILWYSNKGKRSYDGQGLYRLAVKLGATDTDLDPLTKHGQAYRVFRPYWKREK